MGVAMPTGNRRIDRILDPSFVVGLEGRDVDDIRRMRDECEEEETVLSYERRMIHARLDIIAAELERRASGAPASSLIERLPQILAPSGGTRTDRGAFPKLAPPPAYDPPRRRVEKLVSDDTLARLPDLDEAEIRRIVTLLEETEREVSESRRAVQAVLDRLAEELGGRYASGNRASDRT